MVKCQLVNTVDSSNLTTPIIGFVNEDVWWNGKVIIRANSEVHGLASVDTVRERIAGNGEFTFVLNEPSGLGRELVVRAMVLDMEHDEQIDSYGITDGSAGLRGDVIRTSNSDVIKLYAASLINGIAGAFSSSASGLLGNRVYTNSNSLGLSALQNGVVNPAWGGTQAVLDRYASQIASSIERDGFFFEFRRASSSICIVWKRSTWIAPKWPQTMSASLEMKRIFKGRNCGKKSVGPSP